PPSTSDIYTLSLHDALPICQLDDRSQIRDRSIHRKTPIGGDQSETRILRYPQLRLKISHVVVFVTKPLGFAEPDAVDNARMIQRSEEHTSELQSLAYLVCRL